MSWFNRKIGRAFAAVTGIFLMVASLNTACTQSQPTNLPAETAPVPSETAVATATPMSSAEVINIDGVPPLEADPVLVDPEVRVQYESGVYSQGEDELVIGWLVEWGKMRIFDTGFGEVSTIRKLPLNGIGAENAGVVCIDTKGQGSYAGYAICPPLDLERGGLRAVPAEGQTDRILDGTLFISLEPGEELVTIGTGNQLVYQVINSQSGEAVRYVDPKTGQLADGEYKYPDFAERFTPVESSVHQYTAVVGGMEIPISIGVTENVTVAGEDNDNPVKGWTINDQETINAVGDFFLRSCHYRYQQLMGHPEVSYEDYLKLVAEGKGQIDLMVIDTRSGGVTRRVAKIDPAEGFSLAWTNNLSMPVKVNSKIGIYFGVDGQGRIFMATNTFRRLGDYDSETLGEWVNETFVGENINNLFFNLSSLENSCMKTGDVVSVCGDVTVPDATGRTFDDSIALVFEKRLSGEIAEPVFGIQR